jgi:hypothetical protein
MINCGFHFDLFSVEACSQTVDIANGDLIFEGSWTVWCAGTSGSNSRAYLQTIIKRSNVQIDAHLANKT